MQDHIDLTNIAYPDESADIFICSHILEHIPDDRKAMRELRRILHPDGFGLMLVPLVIGVDETTEEQGEYVDRVSLEALRHGRPRPPVRPARFRRSPRRSPASRSSSSASTHFGAEKFRRHGIAENSVLYVVRR